MEQARNRNHQIKARKGDVVLVEGEITVGRHTRIYNLSLTQTRHTDSREVVLTVGITTRVITTRGAITTHRTRCNNHTKPSLRIKDRTEATAIGDIREAVAT